MEKTITRLSFQFSFQPWPVRPTWLEIVLCTKGSRLCFPVRLQVRSTGGACTRQPINVALSH